MNQTAVTKLEEYLNKATKHFEQWHEEQLLFMERTKESYTSTVKNLQEKATSLKEKEQMLLQTAEKIAERLDSEKQEIEAVLSGISQLKSKQEAMPGRRKELQEQLEQQLAALKKQQQAYFRMNQEKQERYEKLQKAVQTYENCLGMRLERTENGRLVFIFTQIDPQEPTKEFKFQIFVDDNDQYQVDFCDPPLQDYSILVQQLNETNNLCPFILAMRKRFKELTFK
eukprot:jgi/Galph1/5708/GphlegSOOS_G4328.1